MHIPVDTISETVLRILATTTIVALFTAIAPALADGQQTVRYSYSQDIECDITSDDIDETLPVSGSTFDVDIECNFEFDLSFEDDASGADKIVMAKTDDLESTDDYDESFEVGVTYTSGLEAANIGGQFAGAFKAQNSTAVYTITYTLPENLEAGEYEGAGVVTIMPAVTLVIPPGA